MGLGAKSLGKRPNEDTLFESVSVLADFSGSDQQIKFIDQSKNSYAITTATGSRGVLGTAQFKWSPSSLDCTGASTVTAYTSFTGNTFTRAIDVASQASFAVGTGDFTIEMWIYPIRSTIRDQYIIATEAIGSSQAGSAVFGTKPFWMAQQASTMDFRILFVDTFYGTGVTFTDRTWQHLALCRASGAATFYKDGTKSATTVNTAKSQANLTPIYSGATGIRIGGDNNQGQAFGGWIDDFRVTIGTARYTANFTVTDRPFGP